MEDMQLDWLESTDRMKSDTPRSNQNFEMSNDQIKEITIIVRKKML